MKNNLDLTICTVSFGSAKILNINYNLVKRLNPVCSNRSWEWLIIENTPKGYKDKIQKDDKRFTVLAGCETPKILNEVKASYHHGIALNKGLKHVTTRFILILDPDFFIIRKNWINELIDNMIKNNLSFWGVPWHPRHYNKYRYFPCVHCLLIDLNKINVHYINFEPELVNKFYNINVKKYKLSVLNSITNVFYSLRHFIATVSEFLLGSIYKNLISRLSIGYSNDTGFHLYDVFSKRINTKYELATPVYKLEKNNLPIFYTSNYKFSKFIEKFLPDKYCFIPKKKGYFTNIGFKELGFTDLNAQNYEEFVWKKTVFGFHLRSYFVQNTSNIETNYSILKKIVNNIYRK